MQKSPPPSAVVVAAGVVDIPVQIRRVEPLAAQPFGNRLPVEIRAANGAPVSIGMRNSPDAANSAMRSWKRRYCSMVGSRGRDLRARALPASVHAGTGALAASGKMASRPIAAGATRPAPPSARGPAASPRPAPARNVRPTGRRSLRSRPIASCRLLPSPSRAARSRESRACPFATPPTVRRCRRRRSLPARGEIRGEPGRPRDRGSDGRAPPSRGRSRRR